MIWVIDRGFGFERNRIRNELDRMHLVTLATSEGAVSQRTELTPNTAASWARSSSPSRPASTTSRPPPSKPGL